LGAAVWNDRERVETVIAEAAVRISAPDVIA